jgi:hypothetical protein
VTSSLNLFRQGVVGFIDWLGQIASMSRMTHFLPSADENVSRPENGSTAGDDNKRVGPSDSIMVIEYKSCAKDANEETEPKCGANE